MAASSAAACSSSRTRQPMHNGRSLRCVRSAAGAAAEARVTVSRCRTATAGPRYSATATSGNSARCRATVTPGRQSCDSSSRCAAPGLPPTTRNSKARCGRSARMWLTSSPRLGGAESPVCTGQADAAEPARNCHSGFPSGTSDLRKPVASALVFRLNDGSATVTNVASFTARYPARVADELCALQTAPGYDDVTGLGTPTSSFLAALCGN
jgi:hypothetical protein